MFRLQVETDTRAKGWFQLTAKTSFKRSFETSIGLLYSTLRSNESAKRV